MNAVDGDVSTMDGDVTAVEGDVNAVDGDVNAVRGRLMKGNNYLFTQSQDSKTRPQQSRCSLLLMGML